MMLITIPDARLCAAPRMGELPSGGRVANIRVASNYQVKDGDEWVSEGMFFDVSLYRGADTIEKYFSKGSPIVVWGQLQERSWVDRDGMQRKSLEVARADWAFPPKNEAGGTQEAAPAQRRQAAPRQAAAPQPAAADDIPW